MGERASAKCFQFRSAAAGPPIPWTATLFLHALALTARAACRSDGSVNRRLLSILDYQLSATNRPRRGVSTADVTLDPSRRLWFRLFLPSAPPGVRLPVVVYFHGGGFTFFSPASFLFDILCRRIARRVNAIVVSVNFRLAPEHRFPAPYEDGLDVLRFLDRGGLEDVHAEAAAAADLSSCFLAGDSSGGNMAHHVARRWAAEGCWERVRVAGMVAVQPAFGGEERTASEVRLAAGEVLIPIESADWYWAAFLPEGADRDHEAANVFGPRDRAELEAAFPAAMVAVGRWDPLQDWDRRYCEALRARGRSVEVAEYPDAPHVFYLLPMVKDSRRLLDDMRSFVEKHRSR